jgi:acetyl-CoA carboxylase carboxyltransferase component/biotin carboxyl carrier protein
MEANPRIQVEHCITEAVTGIDLVQAQLRLAGGASLADLGLLEPAATRGFAVQLRINLESMQPDGSARPAGGLISAYEPPSGPGVRVDGYGYAGYQTSPSYDSLLAKLIVQGEELSTALRRAYRALCEFRLEGAASNIHFLQNLLRRPELAAGVDTRFIERQIGDLLAPQQAAHPHLFFAGTANTDAARAGQVEAPAGCVPLNAPSQGVLVSLDVQVGDAVAAGQPVAVLEAMKMEFVVKASQGGIVRALVVAPGGSLFEGAPLLFLEPAEVAGDVMQTEESHDLEHIRADLAEVLERHAITTDARRPQAVARRRKTGQRTTRENLDDLLDAGSFIEYGALALAAQRRRRSLEELIEQSPADGLVAGIGTVNATQFGNEAARCMTIAYDYTVFAGTQGMMNHKKTDRMLGLAEQWRLPLVLFAEGGGGRPGDSDFVGVAGLDCHTFVGMARLSGLVPLVGVVSGRCFAGNAALLGCCDVIIATRNASIGMAGPAMIEGGGLGTFTPEDVGPTSVQGPNGVIDVLVEDEAEAVQVAKQYLSYFQGVLSDWQCADQRELRHAIPENRLRVYDIRSLIETLADLGSVLELRRQFAPGLVTAFIRIEGKPFGLLANNPMHLGGAIDAQAGDKAARFMQLCDAFDIPMLSLCDTPGFMVGPESEKQATVRHVSRMFVAAASLSVPFFTVVLRKGYGLGAQAMAAGSFHSPLFTIAWPSGEFGAMGLEGAVRLGYAKELAAVEDPAEREKLFDKMVAKAYQNGKAINMASFLEIDAVIDPQETRAWLLRGLNAAPRAMDREGKKRGFVDTW